jgi:hypothetical protein
MQNFLFAICLSLIIPTAVAAQVASRPMKFEPQQAQTMGTSPTALTAKADVAIHDRSRAAGPPQVQIANGVLTAGVYLPDPDQGFYRGTRFDWSGVFSGLQHEHHEFYGKWFQRAVPSVHDFQFDGPQIVVGAASAITGPVEEFTTNNHALGFDEARPGQHFVKIGVGVLLKPDSAPYDRFRAYKIIDHGKRTIKTSANSVEFTQEINDRSSGYGYIYRKTVTLTPGKPQMVLTHSLRNIGAKPITTEVYDHNFLILDHQPTGPDFTIYATYLIKPTTPPPAGLMEVNANEVRYLKTLANEEDLIMDMSGFGPGADNYDFRVENKHVGVGVRFAGDRPLTRATVWSIRTAIGVEPEISMDIKPGEQFEWTITYDYYTVPVKLSSE